MNIIQDKQCTKMYWIEWPDGELSHDFYNITRAKEHAAVIAAR